MTMLVSVSNFVLLYVFWEAVGVCSYLLVGFWYRKPEAAAAGKKAFLVNRVGDFGFALGLFLIWTTYGTLNFHDTAGGAIAGVLGSGRRGWRRSRALYAGGGAGHGDLPAADARRLRQERPVPAARLAARRDGRPHARQRADSRRHDGHGRRLHGRALHAAVRGSRRTRSTSWPSIGGFHGAVGGADRPDANRSEARAGLFDDQPARLHVPGRWAWASLAGIIAGMFHLFTHAFFKALLFLGAGSVMHAMGGVIDMRRFGGLRQLMPITHWTFLFGCLALAGVLPFAGFWSKDAIIGAAYDKGQHDTAVFQSCTGSALFIGVPDRVLHVPRILPDVLRPRAFPHEAGHHAHESPPAMTVPLVILAACSLVVGAYFDLDGQFRRFPGAHALAGLRAAAVRRSRIDGVRTR